MSTAIVITSGKGGTGKTSITGGVASCLAALGHRVLCIDMDIGLRNLDLTLGLSDRALMDFTDVLCGRCTLERAAVPHPVIQGLFLLTAPVTLPEAPLSEAAMKELIHQPRFCIEYILMDSPAGLGEGFRLACCAADRAVVVSTTDASALRDAQRTVSVPPFLFRLRNFRSGRRSHQQSRRSNLRCNSAGSLWCCNSRPWHKGGRNPSVSGRPSGFPIR